MMKLNARRLVLALALAGAASPALAQEQTAGGDLMALERDQLMSELESRYNAALALTRDPAVVSANNTRYIWASEAKAQCGIAVGYLKSGYKDPISVGKCVSAAEWMNRVPPVAEVAPPTICTQPNAVFFDWDSAIPPAEAGQTAAFIANNVQACRWTAFEIVGHADRSGSDSYNEDLSLRRANAVANMLASAGVSGSALTVSARGEREPRVPTADGVREPQNRRVEITAR